MTSRLGLAPFSMSTNPQAECGKRQPPHCEGGAQVSKVHPKTVTPFFNFVSKLTYEGQPEAFLSANLVVELLHDRGILKEKLIGLTQIGVLDVFLSRDHKIPMQWMPISDITCDEPAIPTGYVRSPPEDPTRAPLSAAGVRRAGARRLG
jgi:hypothetical protein